MRKTENFHVPVLLKETIEFLRVKPKGKYIDATLGGGGHAQEIVKLGGELLGIDCDPEAIEYAIRKFGSQSFTNACPPPKVVWGNFAEIDEIAQKNGFGQVEGIIFDLGVSSHQLEIPERGFSFNQKGPLDMRMDPRLKVTAKDLINVLDKTELYELFHKLGEEKFARRYSHAACRSRRINPIETCDELARIILAAAPPRGRFDRTHPATRVFQALRIAVNDELNNLKTALPKATELLKKGGRLVVLSFHSLEDGIVKRFILEKEKKGELKAVTKKPIIPTKEEVEINLRARSAKLRVAERI